MAFQAQQPIKVNQWTPERPRRAKQHSQDTWDRLWPMIQGWIDRGLKYDAVLSRIKLDREAIDANFKPTKPQLERQLRERRVKAMRLANNVEIAHHTDNDTGLSQNASSPDENATVLDTIIPGRHSPLPHADFLVTRDPLGITQTPSLTTGSRPEDGHEALTPLSAHGQTDPLAEERNLTGPTALTINLLRGMSIGEDILSTGGGTGIVPAECTPPGEAGYYPLLDRDVDIRDDQYLPAMDEMAVVAPWTMHEAFSSQRKRARSKTSSHSSNQLFGKRIRTPVHKQPLPLSETALGLVELDPTASRWQQYICVNPGALEDTEPDAYFDAALQAKRNKARFQVRKCLGCMNLVRVYRMLDPASFAEFLQHLMATELDRASERERTTARTFWDSREEIAASLDKIISPMQEILAPESCCYSVYEKDLAVPVIAERFGPMKLAI